MKILSYIGFFLLPVEFEVNKEEVQEFLDISLLDSFRMSKITKDSNDFFYYKGKHDAFCEVSCFMQVNYY